MFSREEIRERLRFAIQPFWQDIKEMKNLHDRAADELALFAVEFFRYVDSRSILTADSEKLIKWEVMYGIPINMNKPLEERRSVVLAKHRGVGTVTIELIKRTAESWYNGQVDVKPVDGGISVKFNSNLGVPENVADVQKALREIIPAHLEVYLLYSYLLIKDIHEKKTLAQIEDIPLSQFAGGA
ncbi:putative phage tail protein [Pseudobacillus sp. FSL P4-0506]|uniref:putative phage tail protein n=1 Tax=Pseudobacillus sp. FSL P4-0506 TaxID=2921576 RepID=UPI0030FBDB54